MTPPESRRDFHLPSDGPFIMRRFNQVSFLILCSLAVVSCTGRRESNADTPAADDRPPGITLAVRNGSTPTLDLVAGQEYVFDRITLEVEDRDIPDSGTALEWLRQQSGFRALDWSGVRETRAYWRNFKQTRIDADVFSHVFEGAAWMAQSNSLEIAVLGTGGKPTGASLRLSNQDFLNRLKQWDYDMIRAEFRLENLARHKDRSSARVKRAVAKVAFVVQTDLSKRLHIPAGAESLRIVWEQKPDERYEIPIRLIQSPLAYGLQLRGELAPQKDVYQPGDVIRATFTALDGGGRVLKLSEFQRNGLTRLFVHLDGPHHEPTFYHEEWLNDFRGNRYAYHLRAPALGLTDAGRSLITPREAAPLDADGTTMVVELHVPEKLPLDMFGTFVVSGAVGRAYGSQEAALRWEKPIQVGKAEATSFEEFGCVACHVPQTPMDLALLIPPMSGIEPLDGHNLQDCVSCHDNSRDGSRRLDKILHLLHMNRGTYTAAKNNCAVCHIREDRIRRVSFEACAPCHEGLHDDNRPAYTDTQCQRCHADVRQAHMAGTATASH
jgi:hypothetical protein